MALNPKQQRFVDEYLVDLNATQAAIRAGYSEKTASVIGHENLTKPEIQEAIQAATEERSKRTEISADRVLKEIARVAFLDPRKLFNADGNLKDIHDLPDEVAAAIASVEVVTMTGEEGDKALYTKKIRFWDKGKHLEMLGRHLKMFTDKTEHSGPNGEPLIPKEVSPLEIARRIAYVLATAANSEGK